MPGSPRPALGEKRLRRASARRRAGLRVSRALARSEYPDEIKAARAIGSCSESVLWAVLPCKCPESSRRVVSRVMCHDRLCGTCAAERARRLARGVEDRIDGRTKTVPGTRAVFLTLTIRNTPEISGETVSQMWGWFRQLRRRKIWQGVDGAAASLEFTNRGRGWHPHLHAVLVVAPGAWLADQSEWSREWGEITGGSVIVDIRPIRGSVGAACREVAKYAAKAPELEDDAAVTELWRAIRGRRLWATSGCLRGAAEADEAPEFAAEDGGVGICRTCGETAAPVLIRWRWDYHRAIYRESLEPPTMGVMGDRRSLWGEAQDTMPPRPPVPEPEITPGREFPWMRMVAKAFGVKALTATAWTDPGPWTVRAVQGPKGRDRYAATCNRCGWFGRQTWSQPEIARRFSAVVHEC